MNDKIKINLQIADSNYPLTINREEEEMVREAAKQVNIRLNAYREYYNCRLITFKNRKTDVD